MPALQTVNFGADPRANSMGTFAKNFLTTLTEKAEQNKNDDLFRKISDKYGPDGKPEDMLWDIIRSEGLSQEYKKNKAAEIAQYATIKNKDKLSPYQQAQLEHWEEDSKVKKDIAATNKLKAETRDREVNDRMAENTLKIPKIVQKYIKDNYATTKTNISDDDLNILNKMTIQQIKEGVPIEEALPLAKQYLELRKEKLDTFKATPRPQDAVGSSIHGYGKVTPKELGQSMEKAYEEMKYLYESDGIDDQTSLRKLLKEAKWTPEEATMILQRVFGDNDRKLRGPKPSNTPKLSKEAMSDDEILKNLGAF